MGICPVLSLTLSRHNLSFNLNTSFERSFYKLSENHKIFDIGSMVLKLWLFKDVQLQPPSPPFSQCFKDSFSCHNLNFVHIITPIF